MFECTFYKNSFSLFFGHTARHAGSIFPNQRLTLGPLQWKLIGPLDHQGSPWIYIFIVVKYRKCDIKVTIFIILKCVSWTLSTFKFGGSLQHHPSSEPSASFKTKTLYPIRTILIVLFPSPWQPPVYFLCLWIWLLYVFHVQRII